MLRYSDDDFSDCTIPIGGPCPGSSDDCSLCCDYRIFYPEHPQLRQKIGEWHDDIIEYVKDPISSGGLGEGHRLFTCSYTQYMLGASATQMQQFYTLFNNDNIDVTDIHIADFNTTPNMNDVFYKAYNDDVPDIFTSGNKPFHQGESGIPGVDPVVPTDDHATFKYYNNYDISFHNTLWATAFMGGFTTGLEWDWALIHRWPNTGILGQPFTMNTSCGTFNGSIASYYDNYLRLSEFMSLVDFGTSLYPKKFVLYPGYDNGIDDDNGVECFYLQDANSNPDKTYGWVHNANHYWYKKYYYNSSIENYCDCTSPTAPHNQYIFIPGFSPNTNYDVTFYRTQMSQTVPQAYTFTSNSLGEVKLDFGSVPLDCDPENADYAFIIDNPALNRLQANSEDDSGFDFNLFPNPTDDKFTLSLIHLFVDAEQKELTVRDVLGQLIYREVLSDKVNSLTIDFSDRPKGMYFVTLKGKGGEKTKKLIVH